VLDSGSAMALMNYTTMQITAKIVYYGPGLCGKTSNLQWIHQKTAGRSRGEMLSLETETDRTLFFDLLPLDVGVIGGMKVRLQLYTVPGQVFYNTTRRLVLKGVDGVVFVADSQLAAREANRESLVNLQANLAELGLSFESVPVVFQYNKRDIRNIIPVEALQEDLNPRGLAHFEAAAVHGLGVFETLKAISRMALANIKVKIAQEDRRPQPLDVWSSPASPGAALEPALESSAPGDPLPFASDHALSALVPETSPEEHDHLEVDFAEEDTGKYSVRRVPMLAPVDIQAELAKLRRMTTSAAPARRLPAMARQELDRRVEDLAGPDREQRQEIRRRASLEVPAALLKSPSDLRLRLSFVRADGQEDALEGGVTVKLSGGRRLDRVTVHLDLELNGKG
jgi:signal recognition particle receptor subunit beta